MYSIMQTLQTITTYIDNYLNITRFSDYCPNGLQVEGH